MWKPIVHLDTMRESRCLLKASRAKPPPAFFVDSETVSLARVHRTGPAESKARDTTSPRLILVHCSSSKDLQIIMCIWPFWMRQCQGPQCQHFPPSQKYIYILFFFKCVISKWIRGEVEVPSIASSYWISEDNVDNSSI